ncbi:hypothetical protein DFJ73DRAFT_298288 [Zopfochytrium polystomum]|nr:hypothetical protein DFJ73DRAFT_298288 [Zopfochytrium polystomum]
MPEGVEGDDEENEIMRGKKSRPLDFDQDTLAVLSVDLTEDVSNSSANSSKLHFEVGRATILSSHAPSSAQSVVSVTRKKVDDTKKKKTSGESGTDKKKKSKSSKKTDGDLVLIEDSPSVKLPKKKKAASGESRSKKKAVVAPPPGPPPDASGFEEVKLVDIEDVSPMQPASAFASFTPKEIVSSSTHRTIVEQDGVTVGFDWLVHGPPNQGVASASITLTIGNVAETSLTIRFPHNFEGSFKMDKGISRYATRL